MNITLSIDESIVERARAAAGVTGRSLNQAVRDYLEQLASSDPQAIATELDAFEASARASPGRLKGWKFNRDEANERS